MRPTPTPDGSANDCQPRKSGKKRPPGIPSGRSNAPPRGEQVRPILAWATATRLVRAPAAWVSGRSAAVFMVVKVCSATYGNGLPRGFSRTRDLRPFLMQDTPSRTSTGSTVYSGGDRGPHADTSSAQRFATGTTPG